MTVPSQDYFSDLLLISITLTSVRSLLPIAPARLYLSTLITWLSHLKILSRSSSYLHHSYFCSFSTAYHTSSSLSIHLITWMSHLKILSPIFFLSPSLLLLFVLYCLRSHQLVFISTLITWLSHLKIPFSDLLLISITLTSVRSLLPITPAHLYLSTLITWLSHLKILSPIFSLTPSLLLLFVLYCLSHQLVFIYPL